MSTTPNPVEVTRTDQVAPGTMKAFDVRGKRILIVNVGGKFYAMNGTCSHMGGDLSKGKLEGTTVTCPRHGSMFDVTTGKNLGGPKYVFLRLKTGDLPAYPVSVEGTSLKIKL